jgi:hypothetical protein
VPHQLLFVLDSIRGERVRGHQHRSLEIDRGHVHGALWARWRALAPIPDVRGVPTTKPDPREGGQNAGVGDAFVAKRLDCSIVKTPTQPPSRRVSPARHLQQEIQLKFDEQNYQDLVSLPSLWREAGNDVVDNLAADVLFSLITL